MKPIPFYQSKDDLKPTRSRQHIYSEYLSTLKEGDVVNFEKYLADNYHPPFWSDTDDIFKPTYGPDKFGMPIHTPFPFCVPSCTPNKDITNGMTTFEGIEELAKKQGAEINAFPLYDIGVKNSKMNKWISMLEKSLEVLSNTIKEMKISIK